MSRNLSVWFCPETIFRRTIWIIATLVSASLLVAFIQIELGHGRLLGFSDLVHLDQENNLPTFFSGVQLVFAGSIAWLVGAREKVASSRWLWRFLGAGLCFMALDETICIHEKANQLNFGSWSEISYFRFAWIIPAFVVVTACGAVLLKLLMTLPRNTAAMLILSGGIFVIGSLGIEMLGAHYYKSRWKEDWAYTFCYTLEEALEMLGPALFIRTALRYAIVQQDAVTEASESPAAAPASVA